MVVLEVDLMKGQGCVWQFSFYALHAVRDMKNGFFDIFNSALFCV